MSKKLIKKCWIIIILSLLIHVSIVPFALGKNIEIKDNFIEENPIKFVNSFDNIWYVDDDNTMGPWNGTIDYPFKSIHKGVDAAKDGDTVYVFNGSYREGFTIDKSIEVIGENRDSTIIYGWWNFVVNIVDDNVSFHGFTIRKDEDSSHQLHKGISVSGDNATIYDNFFYNTTKGIYLSSDNNSISDNSFFYDGIYISSFSNNNIIRDNTVNGKAIIYLEGEKNQEIDDDTGQALLVDCENITVEGLTIYDCCIGVQLIRSYNCNIKNNLIVDNYDSGIVCTDSNDNVIMNNIIGSCYSSGIGILRYSSFNGIINNSIMGSIYGVEIYDSRNNTVYENDIKNNIYGVNLVGHSIDNIISSNIISNNTQAGLSVSHHDSYFIYISDNTVSYNSFYNNGIILRDSRLTTVTNNMINGKPLVYLDGVSHKNIDDAGEVILINCKNIKVENQDLSNTSIGIQLIQTNHCEILKNNISSNDYYGIWIWESNDNNIKNNFITNNRYNGIIIEYSNRNTIKFNEIRENDYGIYFYDYIEWEWEFPLTSKSNKIIKNNIFQNRKQDAFFHNSIFNKWNNNYWGMTVLYYPIEGEIYLERGWHMGAPPPIDMPWVLYDLNPAKKSYDILSTITIVRSGIE